MKYSFGIGSIVAIIGFGIFACEDPAITNPNDPRYEISPPTSLDIIPLSNTSIELSWMDNEEHESGFLIERHVGDEFVEVGRVGPNTTSYIDTGLTYRARYYYRVAVFVENKISSYTRIRNTISCLDCVLDYDGNEYDTIQFGNQIWMVQNLKVTHYRNGEQIALKTTSEEWLDTREGSYCYYGGDIAHLQVYGGLYNWYAINDQNVLAPRGWRVPTDADWKELERTLGISEGDLDDYGWRGDIEGSALAGRIDLWSNGVLKDASGFGESGFKALPGGIRHRSGVYQYSSISAYFWTATMDDTDLNYPWQRSLSSSETGISRGKENRNLGFSVRCIKE
jgi:uncharacterized protein (TIGR02145 family)